MYYRKYFRILSLFRKPNQYFDTMKLDNNNSFVNSVLWFSLFYGVMLLFASFLSSPFIWGVRLVEFISIPASILLFTFIIASFIPAVRRVIISAVDISVRSIQVQPKMVRFGISIFGSVILIFLFWSFRQSLYFLGDGYLLIGSLERVILYSNINIFYKNEPLPGLINLSVDRLLLIFNQDNVALFSIQAVSIMFGLGNIVLAYKIIRKFTIEVSAAVLASICFFSAAISQLYFGYAENYSPVIFFLLLFLFTSIRFLRTKKYFIAIILSYILLFFSHYSMICLFPSFIFLSYIMVKSNRNIEFILSQILGVVVLVILIKITYPQFSIFYERFLNSSNHFLPLTGLDDISFSYTLFSIHHIIDTLNHYLFVFPFLLPLGVLLYIHHWQLKQWPDQTTVFFALTVISTLIFGFMAKSDLGVSRDWDLFSLFLVPAIIAVIIGILKIKQLELQKHIFIIIILTTIAHTGIWIYINSDKEKAFDYFISLPNDFLWSKKSNANAHDDLAGYFEKQQNYKRSLFHYQQFIKSDPTNSRIWQNIAGTYFYVFKDSVKAQKAYEKCLEYGREDWVVFANLGEIYLKQNRYDSALALFDRSLNLNPNNESAKNNKALIIAHMKRR